MSPRPRTTTLAAALAACLAGLAAFAPAPRAIRASAPAEPAAAAPPRSALSVRGAVAPAIQAYGQLPLTFERNRGQTDRRVRFLSRGPGYHLYLTRTEAVLALRRQGGTSGGSAGSPRGSRSAQVRDTSAVLRMKLVGGRPGRVDGVDRLPGVSHYLRGNRRERWRVGVPTFSRVRYREVYPGVDLVYYGNQRELEFDFEVEPRKDPQAITLEFSGARRLELDGRGDLLLHTPAGTVRQRRPVLYQAANGRCDPVQGRYILRGSRRVGFEIGSYDRNRPLVIDPVLSYSTFLGGAFTDRGFGVAVDAAGCAYVAGFTQSADFPASSGALQRGLSAASDVFVTKLNAAGTGLIYSTYLGGTSFDTAAGVAVDSAGRAHVAGRTSSTDFPVTPGAPQPTKRASDDAFVAALDATGGGLVYSTFLGGAAIDQANAITLDNLGCAYVAGTTFSSDFPAERFASGATGGGDAFVLKLNAPGTALLYSRLVSGSSSDQGNGIAVDSSYRAHLCGQTRSVNFPLVNALMGDPGDFTFDGFAACVAADGATLEYSTYLGGSGFDYATSIALDPAGRVYLTGATFSTDFPTTAGSLQTALAGEDDAFVVRLGPAGSPLEYGTYLGTLSGDRAYSIAVDAVGQATVAGECGAGVDGFVTRLDPDGMTARFSFLLGGTGADTARAVTLDGAGAAYVAGSTASADFPTSNPAQAALAGGFDLFVTKISDGAADLAVSHVVSPDPAQAGSELLCLVTVTNHGPAQATGATLRTATPTPTRVRSVTGSQGSWSAPGAGEAGEIAWTLGALSPGQTATLRLAVTSDCSTRDGTPATFNTTVSGSPADPNPLNNQASTTVAISNPGPVLGGVAVDTAVLWPPNGKMVDVRVDYEASDSCDPPQSLVSSLSVTSSEPVTSALDSTSPDWEVVDAHHVRLRAERAEGGGGRNYTITIRCSDSAGGATLSSVSVSVPKSAPKPEKLGKPGKPGAGG